MKRHCGNLSRTKDLPVFPVDVGRREAVGERLVGARRLDKLLLQERREKVGNNWRMKAAEEAELVLSEEENSDGEEQRRRMRRRREVTVVRQRLKMLLSVPLMKKDFSGKYLTMMGWLRLPGEGAVEALERDLRETGVLLKGKKRKNKPGDL